MGLRCTGVHARTIGRLQQLTLEFRHEARHGDVANLIGFAERRIREEFGLAAVRLTVPRDPSLAPAGIARRAGACGAIAVDERWRRDRIARSGDNRLVFDGRDFSGAGISRRTITGEASICAACSKKNCGSSVNLRSASGWPCWGRWRRTCRTICAIRSAR